MAQLPRRFVRICRLPRTDDRRAMRSILHHPAATLPFSGSVRWVKKVFVLVQVRRELADGGRMGCRGCAKYARLHA